MCLQGLLYGIGRIPTYVQWTDSVYAAGPLGSSPLAQENSVQTEGKRQRKKLIRSGLLRLLQKTGGREDSFRLASEKKRSGYPLTIAFVISWGTSRSGRSTG